MTTRRAPAEAALTSMEYIVSVSKRTAGLQLPHTFLRDHAKPPAPPSALLVQGGRSGEVRQKLYLTACLVASGPPHKYERQTPARAWAELLNLEDPVGRGASRVSAAFGWLHEHRYLEVDRQKGRPPQFRLLNPKLDGTDYQRPATEYVTVPLGLWQQHWISALSAAELGILLAILDGPGDDKPGGRPRFLTEGQKERYGFSEDSWTRATRQLERLGLIELRREVTGEAMQYRRMRNVYRFPDAAFDTPPPWPIQNGRSEQGAG